MTHSLKFSYSHTLILSFSHTLTLSNSHTQSTIMTENYNDISHIETYLRGDMDDAGRRAFEAQLADDETMQSEVAAFRQIFDGFDGLKEKAFAGEVAKWVAEAKAKAEDNIVPMQNGAKRQPMRRPMWRRLAVAASIALLLGIGAIRWGGGQYSDTAIAERAYVNPLKNGSMGDNPQLKEIEKLYESAHQNFQAEKYAEAAAQFDQFLLKLEGSPFLFDELTQESYVENARWTGLLAKFAGGKISEKEMKTELEKIVLDPASEYSDHAKKLLGEMGSFWRKF